MKKQENWKPTKFLQDEGGNWVPNSEIVGRFSYFTAELQIKKYQKAIETYSQGKLLDCGAGAVPYYGIYKDLVSDVTCIDWGHSFHELTHIDRKVDLTGKLPFKNSSFDTVLLADVIEHLPNPINIFKETSRVLSVGGRLIVFVPFLYWLHETPHDYHRYTEHALRNYAEANGLEVVYLEPYGGGPDVLIDVGDKIFNKSFFLFKTHRAIWRFLTFIGVYDSYKLRYQKSFPLGYCLVATRS